MYVASQTSVTFPTIVANSDTHKFIRHLVMYVVIKCAAVAQTYDFIVIPYREITDFIAGTMRSGGVVLCTEDGNILWTSTEGGYPIVSALDFNRRQLGETNGGDFEDGDKKNASSTSPNE
ncbi:hypothetical protein Aduo_005592 [Ancylostoma duodenale]